MGAAATTMEVNLESPFRAPADLAEVEQWLLWKYEGGTKVPFTITGRKASSTDPRTWTSYEEAAEHFRRFPKHHAGLGFVFHVDDPFCGIDLDNCLNEDRSVKEWARSLIERFGDTYMEISPSGRGVKIWCRGQLPSNMGKVQVGEGGIEMYDWGRFFTVTGLVFNGAPLEIEDHSADVLTLYEKLRGGSGRNPQHEIEPSGRIQLGRRHPTLVSLAGTMWRRGMCKEAIEAALQTVNARQCEQPYEPEHIRQIVNSIRTWRRL